MKKWTGFIFAIGIFVCKISAAVNLDLQAMFAEHLEDRYANKEEKCNTELLSVYFKDSFAADDNVKEVCNGVKTPCCSKADIDRYGEIVTEAKGDIKEITDWLSMFYKYLGELNKKGVTEIKKVTDSEDLIPALAQSERMHKKVSEYFKSVVKAIDELGCTICDSKHGADFKFKNHRLSQVDVQPNHCQRLLSNDIELYKVLEHLGKLAHVARNLSVHHKIEFTFQLSNYTESLNNNKKELLQCVKQFKEVVGQDIANADTDCIDMCSSRVYLTTFNLPYNFIDLAIEVILVFKQTFGDLSVSIPTHGIDSKIKINRFENELSAFDVNIEPMGIDLSGESKYTQAKDDGLDSSTQGSGNSKKIASIFKDTNNADIKGAVFLGVTIILLLGVLVTVLYMKSD